MTSVASPNAQSDPPTLLKAMSMSANPQSEEVPEASQRLSLDDPRMIVAMQVLGIDMEESGPPGLLCLELRMSHDRSPRKVVSVVPAARRQELWERKKHQLRREVEEAKVTLIDTTAVPRITIAQKMDVLSSQAKCAGHRAVLEGAYAFERFYQGEITAAGKYPPCHTMVLGIGVAGLAAMGTSSALGSVVRAWDVRDVSDQVKSMGGKWITVDFKDCERLNQRSMNKWVTIIGYTDLAGRMGMQASAMYATNMMHMVNHVTGKEGAEAFMPNVNKALGSDEGDIVVKSMVCCKAIEPKAEKAAAVIDPAQEARQTSAAVAGTSALAIGASLGGDPGFIALLNTFGLAGAAGYQAVWGVTHALHTPLMAVTNAISGLTAAGGLMLMGTGGGAMAQGLAQASVAISAVNIAGGFLVTKRMLDLFRKPGQEDFTSIYLLPAAGLATDDSLVEYFENLYRQGGTEGTICQSPDPERLKSLAFLNTMAACLQNMGRHREAEPLHRRILQVRHGTLGEEHPGTVASMNNLAVCLRCTGRHREAEPLYRKTLEIRERILGAEHPDTLTSMNNLAMYLRSMGRLSDAEILYRKTWGIREGTLGAEHPCTLASMNNLAICLRHMGRHQEAEPLYRKTIEVRERILGAEHPDTLTSMNNLSIYLTSMGRHQEAESLDSRTFEARERILGAEHPDTLSSMNNLAVSLESTGPPTVGTLSGLMCIGAIGGLSSQKTAQFGLALGVTGVTGAMSMTLAALPAGQLAPALGLVAAGGAAGFGLGKAVNPMALPQTVAGFHALVGAAAVATCLGSHMIHPDASVGHKVGAMLGNAIGGITFTGSLVAFGKLNGNMIRNLLNLGMAASQMGMLGLYCATSSPGLGTALMYGTTALSSTMGVHLVGSVGGGDMPCCITVLNSYSGWALVAEGMLLGSPTLTVVGSLIGFSGAILTKIMCDAMNRDIMNVIFGGMSVAPPKKGGAVEEEHRETKPEQVADLLLDSKEVMIVPGYGMAVSQAGRAVADIANFLKEKGINTRFSIHPVAGRMPGQMNVLLAEAGVPYDWVYEMDEVQETRHECSIYGMPVIKVWEAKNCIYLKRSMAGGYADLENPVFFRETTQMLLGDGKSSCEGIAAALKAKS
eukprot:g23897.t2